MTYDKNLLPDELKDALLKAPEDSTVALARYYSDITGWQWFATSLTMIDGEPCFFGYVQGLYDEWGSFTMETLQRMNAKLDGKHEPKKV